MAWNEMTKKGSSKPIWFNMKLTKKNTLLKMTVEKSLLGDWWLWSAYAIGSQDTFGKTARGRSSNLGKAKMDSQVAAGVLSRKIEEAY